MAQIPFLVSARTAKLIGQENFTNVEGAVLELVKNSYDADAKNCIVIFDIKYEIIPSKLSQSEYEVLDDDNDILSKCYLFQNDEYVLIDIEEDTSRKELTDFFFCKNAIYIIDNGDGMTDNVIKNQWMKIGTGNKEQDFVSSDGRIKTGAKGIGRFALDRLGCFTEMWTLPKTEEDNSIKRKGYNWIMNWAQFEGLDKSLSDINAQLETHNVSLSQTVQTFFSREEKVLSLLVKVKLESGTVLKITGLKDYWDKGNIKNVYKSLEALIPPKELAIPFNVNFYHLQDINEYGEVDTAFFNDYDYKIFAEYDNKDRTVSLNVTRNELDVLKIEKDFPYIFQDIKAPYDLNTLKNKDYKIEKSIFELTKWDEDEKNRLLFEEVGNFSFLFYFLKIQTSQKEEYPYKEINSAERKAILDKFGGIKIYRDSFRVRPYGDKGNDWLFLGERASQSPAGPGQRIGDWRVRPTQTAGIINISRVNNPNLIDKSDRGALVENTTFETFKRIVLAIINEFEIDRSKLLNPFYLDAKVKDEKAKREAITKEAEKLAEQIIKKKEIEFKNRVEQIYFENEESKRKEQEKEDYKRLIENSLNKFQNEDDKDAELAQVRNLASLGLIVASFAHELKEIRNNVDEIKDLDQLVNRVITYEQKKTQDFGDIINIIKILDRGGQKIKHWVDYSLSAVKNDKRKRGNLRFENYFPSLISEWSVPLSDRNIVIEFVNNIRDSYAFRAFEMDLNTIFSNLISNSIDSFKNLKTIIERKINIECSLQEGNIEIMYSDNGTGIPKVFAKKEDIFLPFITSKKDKSGNNIGTGLGMYLVKNVVNDNNGNVELIERDNGFSMRINFPIRNK